MDVGKAELSGLNKSVKCLGLFSLFTLGEANAEDSLLFLLHVNREKGLC
jgi:hypothetical protein